MSKFCWPWRFCYAIASASRTWSYSGDAIASKTIITNGKEASVSSGVWLAYVHLAVFDAVNAIDHRFQPYLFTADPPPGANEDAAAVAAAHAVLVYYFPGQETTLD